MGVFSDIPLERIASDLTAWQRGRLVAARPTPHGIENSNYFVSLRDDEGTRSEWVLTIMERPPAPTGLEVLARLDAAALPVAAPVADASGRRVGRVAGWPALLSPRLEGSHPERPGVADCRALGSFIGRMHRHTRDQQAPEHPRDLRWLEACRREQAHHLTPDEMRHLRRALAGLAAASARSDFARLPAGVVHGDLFRDNVLMQDHRITGVIDFHHAARAPLAFDLAVAVDDWCRDADAELDETAMIALLRAYHAERALTFIELLHWPVLMVLAATRFWMARLVSPASRRRKWPHA
ncbi:MAG: phosphotransferase [Gammaproteobacteria bacterium]|nr:phosphotransferase [Gammaproteobacteria bacterium]